MGKPREQLEIPEEELKRIQPLLDKGWTYQYTIKGTETRLQLLKPTKSSKRLSRSQLP